MWSWKILHHYLRQSAKLRLRWPGRFSKLKSTWLQRVGFAVVGREYYLLYVSEDIG
jgi:hypothetical protein